MRSESPVYIDIDGTLTDDADAPGKVITERVAKVKAMIEDNVQIVIWSGRGTTYARQFCEMNGLHPLIAVGKPHRCIDDKTTITDRGLQVLPETWLDK